MSSHSEPGLTAFVERVWQFHAARTGGNYALTFSRTVKDVVTHYGVMPDEALSLVRRSAPAG